VLYLCLYREGKIKSIVLFAPYAKQNPAGRERERGICIRRENEKTKEYE